MEGELAATSTCMQAMLTRRPRARPPQVPTIPEPSTPPAEPPYWGAEAGEGGALTLTPPGQPGWSYYGCPEPWEEPAEPRPSAAAEGPPQWGPQGGPDTELGGGVPLAAPSAPMLVSPIGGSQADTLAGETEAGAPGLQLRGPAPSTRAQAAQTQGHPGFGEGAGNADQDKWETDGEGAAVTAPLLGRERSGGPQPQAGAPQASAGAGGHGFTMAGPQSLPAYAAAAANGEASDLPWNGLWGADPLDDDPKPYIRPASPPPPPHWGEPSEPELAEGEAKEDGGRYGDYVDASAEGWEAGGLGAEGAEGDPVTWEERAEQEAEGAAGGLGGAENGWEDTEGPPAGNPNPAPRGTRDAVHHDSGVAMAAAAAAAQEERAPGERGALEGAGGPLGPQHETVAVITADYNLQVRQRTLSSDVLLLRGLWRNVRVDYIKVLMEPGVHASCAML